MKHYLFLLLLIIAAMWHVATAAVQDTSDLFWQKQVGSSIVKVKFIPSLTGETSSKGMVAVAHGTEVLMYDVLTGSLVKQFNKYMGEITDFAISDDSKKLITSSKDTNLIIWDIDKVDTIRVFHKLLIYKFELIDNNSILACQYNTDSIQKIDINIGRVIIGAPINGSPDAITISKDKKYFAMGLNSVSPSYHNVELWNLNSLSKKTYIGLHYGDIVGLAFSSDGNFLVSADKYQTIKIWNLNTLALIKSLVHEPGTTVDLKVIFTPNNGYLISSGGGGSIFTTKIWDTKTWSIVKNYDSPYGSYGGLDIIPDSTYIAVARAYNIILLNVNWNETKVEQNLDIKIQQIYPNPAGTIINIPIEQGSKVNSINFSNSVGQIVKQFENISSISNNLPIDIGFLSSGSYFVNVIYTNKVLTYKFEKIR